MKRRDFLQTSAFGMLFSAGAVHDLLGRRLLREDAPAGQPPQGAQTQPAGRFEQRLHQDFVTFVPGIEYFFLGNGEIQAAVQYSPDRSGELPRASWA